MATQSKFGNTKVTITDNRLVNDRNDEELVISKASIAKYDCPPIDNNKKIDGHIGDRVKKLGSTCIQLDLNDEGTSFFRALVNNYKVFFDNSLITEFIKCDMEIYGLINSNIKELKEAIKFNSLPEHMEQCRKNILLYNEVANELLLSALLEERSNKNSSSKSSVEEKTQRKLARKTRGIEGSLLRLISSHIRINDLVNCVDKHEFYFNLPEQLSDFRPFSKKIAFMIKALKARYAENSEVVKFIDTQEELFLKSCNDFDYNKMFLCSLMVQILFNTDEKEIRIINHYRHLIQLIDKELRFLLKQVNDNNNKNTVLDDEKPTTNDLDTLEEQKDDLQRDRLRRDFKSVSWTEKPKTKSLKKERQPVLSIRSFRQVFDAIDLAREESGELKNEWIIRAIIDRLATDHPAAYEWLKEQKDEFPEVRSDARTGIDFILDKN